MLQHPTIDRLRELGLDGMAKSLRDLTANPESKALDHMEWLGILLEHEMTLRQQKRFEARARTAKLRHLASVEDIDYRTARGLDRTLFLKLANCDWIREHRHCLLTGPCGVGKSWLACALGYKACRENLSVLYQRVPRLFALLALGRGDGRYAKLMRQLAASTFSSLTIGGPNRCYPSSNAICWKSSRTATTQARSSSPVSFRSTDGMSSWAIPRWPMPSSIASSIMPIASN